MDYMRWVDGNWGLLTRLMRGHATVYRATGGLIGRRIPGVPEMLLLDHVGAKSGKKRTTPLVFARDPQPAASGSAGADGSTGASGSMGASGSTGASDPAGTGGPTGASGSAGAGGSTGASGPNIVLIASKGGYPKNPAWYHNLKANPYTTVQIGSTLIPVHAREAAPEEYDRLWGLAVGVYRGYEAYRRRTQRKIPLMVLEPR
jgi:deazaflavin-dependent oxidoreductase (nitroreductase family)